MTKIQITPKYADVKPQGFYVYIHRRASTGVEFYVGKGMGDRAWDMSKSNGRSLRWMNTAYKNGVIVEILQDGMSESDALSFEMWMIAKLRHKGVDLCNITDGGDGTSGITYSIDSRIENSIARGGGEVFCSNGMSFPTAGYAVEWLHDNGWPKAAVSNISRCISGGKRTAYGMTWSRDLQSLEKYIPPRRIRSKTVSRGIGTTCGIIFDCTASAVEYLSQNGWAKARTSAITECANGNRISSYGFSWVWLS